MPDSRIVTQRILILAISSAIVTSGLSLQSQENICGTRLENYTLPVKETYKEPIIVHTFTWCLKVPPRCPKTRIEIRERFRIKTTVKQRTVTECCEGYVLQESEEADLESYPRCVPSCSKKNCINGFCITPKVCLCDQGFQGDNCSEIGDLSSISEKTISSSSLGTTESDHSIGSQDPVTRTTEDFEHEFSTVSEVQEKQDFVTTRIEYPTTRTNLINPELTPFDEIVEMRSDKIESEKKFTDSEFDYRNYVNEESRNPIRGTESPQKSYVKTVQKVILLSPGNDSNQIITNDMTVIIIVGTIVSLCLTTLAAITVFYLRYKIFDSIPISIYSDDGRGKNDKNEERGTTDTIKSLKITSTTLPPLPTFVNPVFPGSQETALITFDAAELNKHYDNGTATISIRVSGNIRDLLESHYDRPPTATCRHNVDQNTEHVYDEIPLTVPLCVRKES